MTAEIEPSTLRVEPLPLDNSYRNICYLVIDTATSEAVAVDPLDADRVLAVAKSNQWRITKILNTHEHWDHTGGNKALKEKQGRAYSSPGGQKVRFLITMGPLQTTRKSGLGEEF